MKMARLRLGIGAKVTILVSRLHPKDVISKAYPNYTKNDKIHWLVVVSEGPRSIRCEEKVVVVFTHPPREQQMVPFDCWAIHRFAHVTEEGDESGVFQSSIVASHNNSGATGTAESNPNVIATTTTNTLESQSNNEPVQAEMPAELVPLMESNAPSINMDDADLVRHMVPGMIDNDNQPLPENIPTTTEQQNNTPEFFSSWEHSGSCYWCLEGGRKSNARLSFNSEVQPTIEQLFEMFFLSSLLLQQSSPKQTFSWNNRRIVQPVMENSFVGLEFGFLWQQSMVEIGLTFGQ